MAIFKFRNLKTGQATPIPAGEFTIGRADDVYINIEDSSISRHHARLLNNEHGFFLEDLGSANGIALNARYMTGRVQIAVGDLVHIGSIPFRIDPEVGDAPAETFAPPTGETAQDKAASGNLIRKSVPLPALARLMETQPGAAAPVAVPAQAAMTFSPASPSQRVELVRAEDAQPEFHPDTAPWWWWMAIFLAGLGTGVVLALYFAKTFLEMGGKVSSLP